ncbi:MAG: CapA family protein [Treponema sp.]|jgi:poly-gamma-glutamate synthesis protein (capsule biosynthesis protein)|nr:CapA family protein [Treponema sp.]
MPKVWIKRLRFVFAAALLLCCQTPDPGVQTPVSLPRRIEAEERREVAYHEEPSPEEAPALSDRLTLIAAGDNLFHISILNDSAQKTKPGEKPGYDFTPIYREVRSLVKAADLAFINQETVMGGEALGYTGYPRFNTPGELAKTLAETGFDIVNHANNHALDRGEEGLMATMDLWDGIDGIEYLGIHRTMEKKQTLIVKNNITLGFLSYTYGTNGISLPRNKPWLVSLINQETMAQEIDALRPRCDVLAVSMHWGEEYRPEPSDAQRGLAEFLAEHQVDLVIGHHPHVLQRFEVLPRPDGGETLCFYSLGNFVSNQEPKETLLGAILYVEIVKEGEAVTLDNPGLLPVVTHYEQGYTNTRVFPLYAYSKELMERHRLYTRDQEFRQEFFAARLEKLHARLIMENPFTGSGAVD